MKTHKAYFLLNPHREALVQAELVNLKEQHAPHYEEIDLFLLKSRIDRLVQAFLRSLEKGPVHFVLYIDRIARKRFTEGYSLEELQTALNLLTEEAWTITVREAPIPDRDKVLSCISGTIGAAKDQLARVYCKELEKSESRAARLEERLNELLAGTISPPVATE